MTDDRSRRSEAPRVGASPRPAAGPSAGGDAEMSVRAVVMPRLASALGVGQDLVTDDLELATLGLSSLEVMEMVYDAEDELDIVVDDDALADVTTVRALVVALAGAVH